MHTNQLATIEKNVALGWELNQPYMGSHQGPQTFGKTGFTGCVIMGDGEKQSGLVILSNHTFPQRKKDKTARDAFYQKIADIIFS